jgi:hypothetical protein
MTTQTSPSSCSVNSWFSGCRRDQREGGARGLTLAAASHAGRRNASRGRFRETITTVAKKTNMPTSVAHSSPGPACPGEVATAAANIRNIKLNRQTSAVTPWSDGVSFIRPRFVGLPAICIDMLSLHQSSRDFASNSAQSYGGTQAPSSADLAAIRYIPWSARQIR